MSDASRCHNDKRLRYLRLEEKELIREAVGSSISTNLDDLKVIDADDGGMGGIRVKLDCSSIRVFGSELARMIYKDKDGVEVSITFNVDKNGDLFEVDFWKVNFSPLISYPKKNEVKNYQ